MPKYLCLECGTEFEDDQTEYLPVCPGCGVVVEALGQSYKENT